MKVSKSAAFTLIELLVVISIIAILAGIALPVFGEVQIRGAQTKALSNAKQVGTACKLFAMDYQGNFPQWTDVTATPKTPAGADSNGVLQTLIPDYLPDKGVFSIPKSKYCKVKNAGTSEQLVAGENEWAYVLGLTDTSNSRFPLLADGFSAGSEADPSYNGDENLAGGVWKGKKAVVVRVDISGTVETLYRPKGSSAANLKATVKLNDDKPTDNLFKKNEQADPPWLTGTDVRVLNPLEPN